MLADRIVLTKAIPLNRYRTIEKRRNEEYKLMRQRDAHAHCNPSTACVLPLLLCTSLHSAPYAVACVDLQSSLPAPYLPPSRTAPLFLQLCSHHTLRCIMSIATHQGDGGDAGDDFALPAIEGIEFVDYVDESQLDEVMRLVSGDLSEPYSGECGECTVCTHDALSKLFTPL